MKRNTSFCFLWAGQSLALFGDVFYIMALITMLLHMTGSATYTAMVPVFRVSGQLLGGVLAPLLIDRFRLHRILVFSQIGQMVYFTALTLFTLLFMTRSDLFLVFVLLFLGSFFEGWVGPARNSLVPRLVPEGQLVKANGYLATTDQTSQFIGWASGGVVVALIGVSNTLWLTVGLYVLSVICVSFVRDNAEPLKQARPREKGSKWESLREGWVTIGRVKSLRTIMMMEVVEGIANGAWMGALLLMYCHNVLGKGDEWWGFINASFLGGTISGGLLVLVLAKWLDRRLGSAIWLGALAFGLFTLGFAYTAIPWLALVICLLMGPPGQIKDIAKRTMFQQNVSNEQLPKVFSAHGTVLTSTFGISAFVMAPIADHYGVQMTYILSAILYGVSVLIALLNRIYAANRQAQVKEWRGVQVEER